MLRQNQVEPVQKGVEFFKKVSPPSLMVLPVAAGKSHIIAEIVNNICDKFLILSPSVELLHQNIEKLRLAGGDASIYSASAGIKEVGHITYATLGSIKNEGHLFKGYKLLIDEADRYSKGTSGMLRKFIKSASIKHILGLTATPFKLQTMGGMYDNYSVLKMLTSRGKGGLLFKDIIHVCQVKEMVEEGWWSPIIYENSNIDTSSLIYNSTKAEYTDGSVKLLYKEQDIEDKIIEAVNNTNRKSILIFVPSVADAIALSAKIPGSEAVYGDMDKKERTRIIKGFKELSIKVVINVNVLSVGFDHPLLDMIICGRATASLSWWYQALGRGTRIHPEKENLLLVDLVGNTKRFGKIEHLFYEKDEEGWKLYGDNDILLSGIPIDEIGQHTRETEKQRFISTEANKDIITFGRFSGKRVEDTPDWWKQWMLDNFKFDKKTNFIKEKLLQ